MGCQGRPIVEHSIIIALYNGSTQPQFYTTCQASKAMVGANHPANRHHDIYGRV
jgi:hypothetical protein